MNIAALRARLVEIDTERRSIHEGAVTRSADGAFIPDEQARWEALDTEEAEVRAAIVTAEAEEARAAKVAESRARWGSLQVGTTVPTDDVDVRSLSRAEARDRALKRTEVEAPIVALRDDQATKLHRLIRTRSQNLDGDSIARRLLVTESDAYRSAFMKAVISETPAWTAEEARAMAEFRAMSGGTDASGGFGVPVLIDPTIITTAQGSLNPFRRIARQVTITTDQWKGVSSAGVSWSYDAEAAEVSDDSPTLAQPAVPVYTARGFIPYSIEVGEDYPGFAEEMSRLLAEGYDELQATAFATGSGSTQPTGILVALDANTNVEVVVTTDGTFTATDVNKAWKALPDRWKANASWVMSDDVATDIAAWGDAYGTRTTDATGELLQLRGRPVERSSAFPSFDGTTTAANLLVVGDFRNYLIVDRAGMSVELIPHLFGTTNGLPTGQRGWFAHARHGADSINDLGFRLLQNQ